MSRIFNVTDEGCVSFAGAFFRLDFVSLFEESYLIRFIHH